MKISRRDFMRYAGAAAATLGLSGVELAQAAEVLASATSPAVIWLSGSGCTGCSVSLLNAVNPTIDQVLLNTISLKYHPNADGRGRRPGGLGGPLDRRRPAGTSWSSRAPSPPPAAGVTATSGTRAGRR